jgi:hypothetical protein
VNLYDPNHHLKRIGGRFWLSLTLHGSGQPERLRVPLNTKDLACARRRRDEILRRHPDAHALLALAPQAR